MARLSYRGRKRLKETRSAYVDTFNSGVLEDWMHDVDDGDDLVHYYADAIAKAEHARDEADTRYGYSDETARSAEQSAERLTDALELHFDALVAEVCALVAKREGEWVEWRSDEEVEAAVHEARNWLQAHPEAAKRAGVWEEVTA